MDRCRANILQGAGEAITTTNFFSLSYLTLLVNEEIWPRALNDVAVGVGAGGNGA